MNLNWELRRHPLIFVDDLDSPQVDKADVHHLVKSLRLSVGDLVNLSDGAGRWASATLTSHTGSVEVAGRLGSVPAARPTLGVAFAPTKGVRPEAVVKKLTELGIDRLALVQSRRSVVTYDQSRAERLLRRLSVTVREACQQSRQPRLPEVTGVFALEDFVAVQDTVVLADPAGSALWNSVLPAKPSLWVTIGPEGGWSDSERSLADSVSLPGGVLRSETAAVAAGVVLAALREQRTLGT
jgi:16S rRNA (uracil1498-N3)-methyltransferase